IVHPQRWPDDLDYADKRVVVIGSGATAITLIPSLAARARHVTMLQRSPSYVASLPARNPLPRYLRRVLPGQRADAAVRWFNATGLELLFLGGLQLSVDGGKVDLADKLSYKGMMLEGVPNLALAIGYTNASWTLKCDLTCDYVCRLLNHMRAAGQRQCTPVND